MQKLSDNIFKKQSLLGTVWPKIGDKNINEKSKTEKNIIDTKNDISECMWVCVLVYMWEYR